MKIEKVINNNIVSSFDEKGREIVVMGRGIGFGAKPGAEIDKSRIEKIFKMDSNEESERLQSLFADIPIERIKIADEIILCWKESFPDKKISKNIYMTLTDHINFAIDRAIEGMNFKNPLLWEIKRFYPDEYVMGKKALEIIEKRLGISLPEDEAASIAMHFANAGFGTEMPEAMDITKLIQNVLKIIRYNYNVEIDEDSINYERFITHLKFFAQRIVTNRANSCEDPAFHEMIKERYKNEYKCAEKIKKYIEAEYKIKVPDEEMIYLTVHIKRITTK